MPKRDSFPTRAILRLLAFTPAAAGAFLVARYAVDVPVAEDWDRASWLEAPSAGLLETLSLPRLVAVANHRWFGDQLTLEMGLAYLLVLATAVCVYGLLVRSLEREDVQLCGVAFLGNLLLFLPLQWENLLWAGRAWFLLPGAALAAALLVLGSGWRAGPKAAAVALLAGAVALGVPGALAPPGDGASGMAGLRFAATLLGSPFARTTLVPVAWIALPLGVVGVAVFAACALAGRRDPAFRRRRLPWVVLAGVAVVVALGLAWTSGADPGRALLPRYTSVALYLWLGSLPLAVLALRDLQGRLSASRLAGAPAFGFGALVVPVGLAWLVGIQGMQEWQSARLRARTALALLDRFPTAELGTLDPRPGRSLDSLRRAAAVLGLDVPRVGAGLEPLERGAALPADAAQIERVRSEAAGLEISGYAWLPAQGRRADGVVIAEAGSRRAVALAELRPIPLPPIPEHDHIYNHYRHPGIDETAAWRAWVPRAALPEGGEVRLQAFAVDADALRLHALAGRVVVRGDGDDLAARLRPGGDEAAP